MSRIDAAIAIVAALFVGGVALLIADYAHVISGDTFDTCLRTMLLVGFATRLLARPSRRN